MTINVSAPVIAKLYNLDNATLALIFQSFLIAYTVGPAAAGWFLDKVGSRRGYIVSMSVWSGAGVLTAFAWSIGHGLCVLFPFVKMAPIVLGFMLCRFILGLGESANWPAAIKTISEWFPLRERAFAVGCFNSGSSVGVAIAPVVVTWLLIKHGWQAAFVLVGLIGYVWVALWLLFYHPLKAHPWVTDEERDYISSSQQDEHTEEEEDSARWIDVLGIPQIRGIVFTRFFMDPIWWFYTFWLPTYFAQDRQVNLKEMAIFTTLSFIASDLGNIFGGWASSALIRRGYSTNAARKTVMVPCAILMMFGLVVPFVSLPLAVSIIAVVMFCYQSWSVNMLTLPTDIVPRRLVASAAGLSHMGAGIGGMVVTYVAGLLSTMTGSFTSTVMLMGAMPLVGIILLLAVIGRIAPYHKKTLL